MILLGVRSTGRQARIVPVSKRSVIRHCMMNSVIGVGLYQGMEFIMQQGPGGLLAQWGILWSRLRNNLNLVRRSRVFSFVMGRDLPRNYATLVGFLEDTPSGRSE